MRSHNVGISVPSIMDSNIIFYTSNNAAFELHRHDAEFFIYFSKLVSLRIMSVPPLTCHSCVLSKKAQKSLPTFSALNGTGFCFFCYFFFFFQDFVAF